ncbi:MAG: hypothetical protein RLY86_4320 [Pseudomonadota bacterium]|jgi:hypothetical protein
MDRLTLYIALHAAFAAALALGAGLRLIRRNGGLVEWGNEVLLIGLAFILALTAAMMTAPTEG